MYAVYTVCVLVRCIHCVCASCVFETSLTLTGHRRCRMLSVLVDWLNQREMNCRTRSRAQPPRRKLTLYAHMNALAVMELTVMELTVDAYALTVSLEGRVQRL